MRRSRRAALRQIEVETMRSDILTMPNRKHFTDRSIIYIDRDFWWFQRFILVIGPTKDLARDIPVQPAQKSPLFPVSVLPVDELFQYHDQRQFDLLISPFT